MESEVVQGRRHHTQSEATEASGRHVKNQECCPCFAVLYKHSLIWVRHQRHKGRHHIWPEPTGCAPVLLMCRASKQAEALSLSSPLPCSSRAQRQAASRPTRAHRHPRRPPTHSWL